MSDKIPDIHSNYFNEYTAITTVDDNTAVVPGKEGHRIFITDVCISSATAGGFVLTNDGGTILFGGQCPINGSFTHSFLTPIVNETLGDQVEMDKDAADDDWDVFISGYYAP